MATGSYLTPNHSRSQSEIQGDLHNFVVSSSGKKSVFRLKWIPVSKEKAAYLFLLYAGNLACNKICIILWLCYMFLFICLTSFVCIPVINTRQQQHRN
ncbi:hypothetical protein TNCV_2129581 [Trichonephila clavipes]|nr:hypothetical protein TNCV_2129581 [Trichonephila clavipes]